MVAALLAGVLLGGLGRAQEPVEAPAPEQPQYQMEMAGTRACWVMNTATGELVKCVLDSSYDPTNCKWYWCGNPKDAKNYLTVK